MDYLNLMDLSIKSNDFPRTNEQKISLPGLFGISGSKLAKDVFAKRQMNMFNVEESLAYDQMRTLSSKEIA